MMFLQCVDNKNMEQKNQTFFRRFFMINTSPLKELDEICLILIQCMIFLVIIITIFLLFLNLIAKIVTNSRVKFRVTIPLPSF
jgi:hypothetical protein